MTEKWREDEEYMSYVQDLLETEAVKKLANYTQHVHSTRLEHSPADQDLKVESSSLVLIVHRQLEWH